MKKHLKTVFANERYSGARLRHEVRRMSIPVEFKPQGVHAPSRSRLGGLEHFATGLARAGAEGF